MAEIKITVATPAFGEMFYTPYVQSMLRLQRAVTQRKWTMRHNTISYAYVGEARNFLLSQWYDKSDSSHLLFVDADMGFEPQLIFDMVALDKPVVGVIYTKRQVDLPRLAALAAKGGKPEQAIARAHDFIVRPLRGRMPRRLKGFMEVAGCGTGIMLIQRGAIATMLKTLPEINDSNAKKTSPFSVGLDRMIRAFDTIVADGVPLMDDFAFCHRWHVLCKGELWARADQSVTHIGLHKFAGRYTDAGGGGPRITVTQSKPVKFGRGKAQTKAQTKTAGRIPAAAPPSKSAPREHNGQKPPAGRASKDDDVEPATADQMRLAFLHAQIDSPRWGRYYQAFLRQHGLNRATMIDRADLSNADQNKVRARLVSGASGNLFHGFPSDVQWVRGKLAPAEFHRLKYLNCEPWVTFTRRTRLVTDGARNLDNIQVADGPHPVNANINAVLAAVRAGAQFPELILVAGENGDLILLEGHARATAYVAANVTAPVGVFIGSSPAMKRWALY